MGICLRENFSKYFYFYFIDKDIFYNPICSSLKFGSLIFIPHQIIRVIRLTWGLRNKPLF